MAGFQVSINGRIWVSTEGPHWTVQNRPFVDTANPAISGVPRLGVEFYFTASCVRKVVWTLVR